MELLSSLKLLILINLNILAIILSLMELEDFHYPMAASLSKMWWFWALILVRWCMVIIRRKLSWFFVKIQQGNFNDTTLNAEKKFSINVTEQQKKFCLKAHSHNPVQNILEKFLNFWHSPLPQKIFCRRLSETLKRERVIGSKRLKKCFCLFFLHSRD